MGGDRFWSYQGFNTRGSKGIKNPFSRLDAYQTTRIHNNRMHHGNGDIHTFGIDLDDGSTNYHIYNNLLLGVGIKLQEGFYRHVYNNILITGSYKGNGKFNVHVPYAQSQDIIEKNIMIQTEPYKLAAASKSVMNASGDYIDSNWFYDFGEDIVFPSFWAELGYDNGSLVNVNPLFTDPAQNDYTVENDLAMTQIGFKNFPMDQFGKPDCEYQSPIYYKTHSDNNTTVDVEKRELWLGATTTAIYNNAILSLTGSADYNGVFFEEVPDYTAAERMGFEQYDVIKEVNGKSITTKQSFYTEYEKITEGQSFSVDLLRGQTILPVVMDKPTVEYVNSTTNGSIDSEAFRFVGNWTDTGKVNQTNTCIGGDLMYVRGATPEDYFEYDFDITGDEGKITYQSRVSNNEGKVKMSIKNRETGKIEEISIVDCYVAESNVDGRAVYTSKVLKRGSYILKAEYVSG